MTACFSQEQTPSAGSGATPSTPSVATGPQPTPISEADREMVSAFAAEYQLVAGEWDLLHGDFDDWRSGLVECAPSSAQAAFRGFVEDFNPISAKADALPASGIARELPHDVVEAVSIEAAALRKLRDNWQPGNVSLLEEAGLRRNEAATLLRNTADRLDELLQLDRPEGREEAKVFAEAFVPIDADWNDFYDAYDQLRSQQADLSSDELVTELEKLYAQLQNRIIRPLEDLPYSDATADLADDLFLIALDEKKELNGLLAEFRGSSPEAEAPTSTPIAAESAADLTDLLNGDHGKSASKEDPPEPEPTPIAPTATPAPFGDATPYPTATPATPEPKESVEPPQSPAPASQPWWRSTPTPEPEPEPTSAEPSPFVAMNLQIVESDATRREVKQTLKKLSQGIGPSDRAALAAFAADFDLLLKEWAAFHLGYDEWVSDEGGCYRIGVVIALDDFNQRLNELAAQTGDLSQSTRLRPVSALLIEAVGQEQAAFRSFRSAWQPFDLGVYRGLDEERANGDKLRNLAARRLQEVMERFETNH